MEVDRVLAGRTAEVKALRKQEWAAPLRAQIAADIQKVETYSVCDCDHHACADHMRDRAVRIARGAGIDPVPSINEHLRKHQ